MGMCYKCSVFGICLSIWAISQLAVMGYYYVQEVPVLIEDVKPHEYKDLDDYFEQVERNFKNVGSNCYIVAYIYIWLLTISVFFMLKSRLWDIQDALKKEDDEFFCNPPQKKKESKKKKFNK